jgi:hypothetical protein
MTNSLRAELFGQGSIPHCQEQGARVWYKTWSNLPVPASERQTGILPNQDLGIASPATAVKTSTLFSSEKVSQLKILHHGS